MSKTVSNDAIWQKLLEMDEKLNESSKPQNMSVATEEIIKEVKELRSILNKSGVDLATVKENTAQLIDLKLPSWERLSNGINKAFNSFQADSRRIEQKLEELKHKEPEEILRQPEQLIIHRLEPTSKAVIITGITLFLIAMVSIWINCNQYRTYKDLKDADLKYRTIKTILSPDDEVIAFIEKEFTHNRDKKRIKRIENRVIQFEDSVRNYIRNKELTTYKDSIARKLLRESEEIKTGTNTNRK